MEIRKQLKVCTSTFWSIESRQILDLYQNVDPRQILEPRQLLDPRQNFINPRNPLGARNFLNYANHVTHKLSQSTQFSRLYSQWSLL